jgi:long-subunit acyl-CoA synthetase (AMP-forming)
MIPTNQLDLFIVNRIKKPFSLAGFDYIAPQKVNNLISGNWKYIE